MKMRCFVIFAILVVGLSLDSAQTIADKPTPTHSPINELANLTFKIGMAYPQAQRGKNVTIFNSLVDQYNALVRQYFGKGADALLKSKINATNLSGVAQKQQVKTENSYITTKNPFNASSDLSKFGKQRVRNYLPPGMAQHSAEYIVNQKLNNF